MDDRTKEAVEFRQRLHEASREVQQATQDETEAQARLSAIRERKRAARRRLDDLISSDMEPLPLFDQPMPSLEETLAAESELDEAEQAEASYCLVCAHSVPDDGKNNPHCKTCKSAEMLGVVGIDGDEQVTCFFLYTLLDSKGQRQWIGSANGDEFGDWAETDKAEYWPKDDDVERAVQKRFGGVKVPALALTDWHVTPDGSRVALYFGELKQPEPKPAKKRAKK